MENTEHCDEVVTSWTCWGKRDIVFTVVHSQQLVQGVPDYGQVQVTDNYHIIAMICQNYGVIVVSYLI